MYYLHVHTYVCNHFGSRLYVAFLQTLARDEAPSFCSLTPMMGLPGEVVALGEMSLGSLSLRGLASTGQLSQPLTVICLFAIAAFWLVVVCAVRSKPAVRFEVLVLPSGTRVTVLHNG